MSTTGPSLSSLRRAPLLYRQEAGQSLIVWLVIALLQFATQIVLRHELKPGEFGIFNTALGVIGLMTLPLVAMNQAFTWYLAGNHPASESARLDALRAAMFLITETLTWLWAAVSLVSLFLILPLLSIIHFGLQLCILLNVLAGLGILVSAAICRQPGQGKGWTALLLGSIALRVLLCAGAAFWQPVASAALVALLLASVISLIPALRHIPVDWSPRFEALRALLDRDLLVYLSATFSVFLGIFLFINADRLVAQYWIGNPADNNVGFVYWTVFDDYQTAGLLGRALLWGTQPLLFIWFSQRSRLERTTSSSMTFFWIYLGALIAGVVFLFILKVPLSWICCGGNYADTASRIPIFCLAILPIGLLQAFGFFALASRRFQECFTLGGCGVAYAFLQYFEGREANIMPAYMFGGGMVAVMIMLFVGVVRWGRKQP